MEKIREAAIHKYSIGRFISSTLPEIHPSVAVLPPRRLSLSSTITQYAHHELLMAIVIAGHDT